MLLQEIRKCTVAENACDTRKETKYPTISNIVFHMYSSWWVKQLFIELLLLQLFDYILEHMNLHKKQNRECARFVTFSPVRSVINGSFSSSSFIGFSFEFDVPPLRASLCPYLFLCDVFFSWICAGLTSSRYQALLYRTDYLTSVQVYP